MFKLTVYFLSEIPLETQAETLSVTESLNDTVTGFFETNFYILI